MQKKICFTVLFLLSLQTAQAAETVEKRFCDMVNGVFGYTSPDSSIGRIDCINKTSVYGFTSVDNVSYNWDMLQKKTVLGHKAVLVMRGDSVSRKDQDHVREAIKRKGGSVIIIKVKGDRITAY